VPFAKLFRPDLVLRDGATFSAYALGLGGFLPFGPVFVNDCCVLSGASNAVNLRANWMGLASVHDHPAAGALTLLPYV